MNVRLTAGATVVTVGLALLAAWVLELPLERAFVLSPVIVVVAGIVAMTGMLLTRAAIESYREIRNPRRFWIGVGIAVVAIGILGALGVELPREGG